MAADSEDQVGRHVRQHPLAREVGDRGRQQVGRFEIAETPDQFDESFADVALGESHGRGATPQRRVETSRILDEASLEHATLAIDRVEFRGVSAQSSSDLTTGTNEVQRHLRLRRRGRIVQCFEREREDLERAIGIRLREHAGVDEADLDETAQGAAGITEEGLVLDLDLDDGMSSVHSGPLC